jgi:hypothetical protein
MALANKMAQVRQDNCAHHLLADECARPSADAQAVHYTIAIVMEGFQGISAINGAGIDLCVSAPLCARSPALLAARLA